MSGRLPAGLLVSALLRRVNDLGGMGVVRARGEPRAGAILVVEEGGEGDGRVLERGLALDGRTTLIETLPPGRDAESYWQRRRERDPDLWVLELSIPAAQRLDVLTMLDD